MTAARGAKAPTTEDDTPESSRITRISLMLPENIRISTMWSTIFLSRPHHARLSIQLSARKCRTMQLTSMKRVERQYVTRQERLRVDRKGVFPSEALNNNNLTHSGSLVLQSGTILAVEREEDEFECPECWKQWDGEQTFFCKLMTFVRHVVSLILCIFDEQNGYLPHDPAKGQTGGTIQ